MLLCNIAIILNGLNKKPKIYLKYFQRRLKKINKSQRIILGIFIPIIVFFIALAIANSVGVTSVMKESESDYYDELLNLPTTYITYTHDPFDWGKTWYVWTVYFVFCCIFEYKLFADKKKEKEQK